MYIVCSLGQFNLADFRGQPTLAGLQDVYEDKDFIYIFMDL